MSEPVCYRINSPKVIHQNIDGEVVVINLDTGNYYSLTESAARIWEKLDAGRHANEIAAALRSEYSDCAADVETLVSRFVEELRAESLIVPASDGNVPAKNGVHTNGSITTTGFSPPEIKKFTDMRELLLLDPVHEVDQTGWPQAKPDAPPRPHANE